MSEILSELSTTIIEGNLDDIVDLTQDALDDGLDAKQILDFQKLVRKIPIADNVLEYAVSRLFTEKTVSRQRIWPKRTPKKYRRDV